MPDVLSEVLEDLAGESSAIVAWIEPLDEKMWRTMTPAEGWDIATTIAHLAWTDEMAVIAATDKAAWDEKVLAAIADPIGYVDACALEIGKLSGAELLAGWRASQRTLQATLTAYPVGQKMPWFGPPMSPTSMATARLMETWAHGIDIADALGIDHRATSRIKHVAHLGVRTRNFAFNAHGFPPPVDEFRVDLAGPLGDTWSWGPRDAAQSVRGSAYDFCLLVTQRRHRRDTDLVAVGPDASQWLDIAQAFAGPSGGGREAQS